MLPPSNNRKRKKLFCIPIELGPLAKSNNSTCSINQVHIFIILGTTYSITDHNLRILFNKLSLSYKKRTQHNSLITEIINGLNSLWPSCRHHLPKMTSSTSKWNDLNVHRRWIQRQIFKTCLACWVLEYAR